tara:strand:- start:4809 stop:5090 length:282 start_codon:yes stop_codon:yes gene_type:complete
MNVMVVVPAVASASTVTSIYVEACAPTVRVASCQRSDEVRFIVLVLLLVSSWMVRLPLLEVFTPLAWIMRVPCALLGMGMRHRAFAAAGVLVT